MTRSQPNIDWGVERAGHGFGFPTPGHCEYHKGAEQDQGLGANIGGSSETAQALLSRGYTMHVVSLGLGGHRR
jgi:hypothetical protein